jgi:hypothetical protein
MGLIPMAQTFQHVVRKHLSCKRTISMCLKKIIIFLFQTSFRHKMLIIALFNDFVSTTEIMEYLDLNGTDNDHKYRTNGD